jgi:hypothetical protein
MTRSAHHLAAALLGTLTLSACDGENPFVTPPAPLPVSTVTAVRGLTSAAIEEVSVTPPGYDLGTTTRTLPVENTGAAQFTLPLAPPLPGSLRRADTFLREAGCHHTFTGTTYAATLLQRLPPLTGRHAGDQNAQGLTGYVIEQATPNTPARAAGHVLYLYADRPARLDGRLTCTAFWPTAAGRGEAVDVQVGLVSGWNRLVLTDPTGTGALALLNAPVTDRSPGDQWSVNGAPASP